jgi:hypothetical protein
VINSPGLSALRAARIANLKAAITDIRASIREQWRQRLVEEERGKLVNPFDYITLGINVANAMAEFQEEIDQDIADAIAALEERRAPL